MTAKNPKYLKPQDKLTAEQRKDLGVTEPYTRPARHPNEATSVVICNSTTKGRYRTGYGEVAQPIRQGATRALEIPSYGVRT